MIRTKMLVAAVAVLALAGAVVVFEGGSASSVTAVEGAPFPNISLPRFRDGAPSLTTADLGDGIVVVNFFSSWCGPCRAEHPLLMDLAKAAPIIGINYMDKRADAQDFLDTMGNPYRDIAVDADGVLEQVLGMDSVPRTLVLVGGRVVYAHRGRLTSEEVEGTLRPLLKKFKKQT